MLEIGDMFESLGPPPLDPWVRMLLVIWCVLLILWLPFAGLSAMVFEGGDTAEAYVFAWSVWIYPVLVAISFIYGRKKPDLVFLPLLTLLGVMRSGFFHHPR